MTCQLWQLVKVNKQKKGVLFRGHIVLEVMHMNTINQQYIQLGVTCPVGSASSLFAQHQTCSPWLWVFASLSCVFNHSHKTSVVRRIDFQWSIQTTTTPQSQCLPTLFELYEHILIYITNPFLSHRNKRTKDIDTHLHHETLTSPPTSNLMSSQPKHNMSTVKCLLQGPHWWNVSREIVLIFRWNCLLWWKRVRQYVRYLKGMQCVFLY